MNKSESLYFAAYLPYRKPPAAVKKYHQPGYNNQVALFLNKKCHKISALFLHGFSSLDNSNNYDNKCNDKQGVNDPASMKCKKTNQPSDDKDNCNDVQYVSHKIYFIITR